MKHKNALMLATLATAAILTSSCATAPNADPDAQAILRASTEKLKSAQTLQVSGTRVTDPGPEGPGSGPLTQDFDVSVSRPDKLAYKISDLNGKRRLLSDGRSLTWTDDLANLYDTVPSSGGTIDAVAAKIEKVFNYEPIGLELLGSDPMKTLLDGVTSGKVVKDEIIGGTPCRHLSFTQSGLQWDLWVGVSDQLPRQLVLMFTDRPGRETHTVRMKKWTINRVMPASEFEFTPRRDAQKAEVIPMN